MITLLQSSLVPRPFPPPVFIQYAVGNSYCKQSKLEVGKGLVSKDPIILLS